jgi:phosphatidylserine/phosphatidylglycerophosphate/cardiolipin synthase-like enzyme
MEHHQMFKKGVVIKCPKCNTYCYKSEGCPTCGSSQEVTKDNEVAIRIILLEKWGKRLWHIGMRGTEDPPTSWDEERYEDVLEVSGEMKDIWDSKPPPPTIVNAEREALLRWSTHLRSISDKGLEHATDSFDIERYLGIQEISEDLEGFIESYKMDIEDESPSPASGEIRFVADRAIPEAWTQMIKKAEDRIYIASPWIYGVDQFFTDLSEAKEKRIIVKILVRPPEAGKESEHKVTVRRLNQLGFYVEPFEKLHAKMIVVDDKEVYIGSANIIPTSVHENPEAGICTTEKSTVSEAMLYFEAKWEEAIARKWK